MVSTRIRRAFFVALFLCAGAGLGPSASAAQCPRLDSKSIENDLAQLVGTAVLYPMDEKGYEGAITCLFPMYTQREISLAGLKWDVTHALLRSMAADLSAFLLVLERGDPKAVSDWIDSFPHAASWPGAQCPRPDPMTLAGQAVESGKPSRAKVEALRKKIILGLAAVRCRVAN